MITGQRYRPSTPVKDWLPRGMPIFPEIAGLTLWLKADGTLWQDSARTTPVAADSDPVGAWDDASGNNAHATQATAGNRPTYRTGIVNGKPILRFDGSSDRLGGSSASAATKPFTVFGVVLLSAGSITGASVGGGLHWQTGSFLKQDVVNIATDPTATPVVFTIFALTYSATGVFTFYRNGAVTHTGTNNQTFTASTTVIGYNGASNGELANGDMAEIIKYNSVLTATQMNEVGSYLETKYGIAWADI